MRVRALYRGTGLRLVRLCLTGLIGLLLFSGAVLAQVEWDDSGNSKLNGTFRFREVILNTDENGSDELARRIAHYGTITFDGNGSYTVSSSFWSSISQTTAPNGFTGGYSIAESGYGFLVRDPNQGGWVYGLIAGDVFIGSSTEDGNNTLFVAVRVAETNVADFSSMYQAAYISFPESKMSDARDASFNLDPNGAGTLATIVVNGYIGRNMSLAEQRIGGAKYAFETGVGTLNLQGIVTGKQIISGMKEFYVSPDGSFLFGGSRTDADFFIAIRKPTTAVPAGALSGSYFHAGLELYRADPAPEPPALDSFYGSFSVNNRTLIGHQRVLPAPDESGYDYAWSDDVVFGSDGVIDEDEFGYRHLVSADGKYRLGFGRGDYIGAWFAMAIPSTSASGSGPYITPVGVLNAGSYAPFTSGLARGTVVTMFGSNFASELFVDGSFPLSLGGVVVRVNGQDAPVYVVSPNQISFVLPYNLEGSIAEIQVLKNGMPSNRVTVWLNLVSPGVFTDPANGVGTAAALHADFSLVTAANPALSGETIQVYLTGLGAVAPAVVAGEPGPTNPLSRTTEDLLVFIGDYEATIVYSGLAPFLGGLYQLNVTVSPDQEPGNWLLYIDGPDAYVGQASIPVGQSTTGNELVERKAKSSTRRKGGRTVTGSPRR
jgi:uncharacterized protein (TIGR03437 family)